MTLSVFGCLSKEVHILFTPLRSASVALVMFIDGQIISEGEKLILERWKCNLLNDKSYDNRERMKQKLDWISPIDYRMNRAT